MIALLAGFVLSQDTTIVQKFVLSHALVQSVFDLISTGKDHSLLPSGVTIVTDPRDNAIVAKGPKTGLAELKRLIEQFDQAPMKLRLQCVVTWPKVGREISSDSTVYNVENWILGDKATGYYVTAYPRIQYNGKLKVDVEVHEGANVAQFQGQVDQGSVIVFDGMEAWAEPGSGDLRTFLTHRREGRHPFLRTDGSERLEAQVALTLVVPHVK